MDINQMKDSIEELLISNFESLLKEGTDLIKIAAVAESMLAGEEIVRVYSWVTRTQQLLLSLNQGGGPYYQQLSSIIDQANRKGDFFIIHAYSYLHFSSAVGCLKGAYEDFKNGQLCNIRAILHADIFSDFLEMAEHLLECGYKDAAAVLIGAVLENSLRKLASDLGITLQTDNGKPKTIEPLNIELAKMGKYDKLIQKQVTTWADLRNKAAHGEFDKYDINMVKMMLISVQDFCAKYLR